ncbi:unnamed protein product [Didymodactylos carnosus]|uniref:Uncharacterized protein n=1 Tax=Didymodactylos carnosus TaxID=1234261 RepID=A0A815CL21_9BILA|nr:unnamed protein product [Didymodactylos carnosus]CAF4077716.1 unnamed protein product [Didymodactylos carnosus]
MKNPFLLPYSFDELLKLTNSEILIVRLLSTAFRGHLNSACSSESKNDKLKIALEQKRLQLQLEIIQISESFKKSDDDIIQTTLNIYNGLIRSEPAKKHDIYTRCPQFNRQKYLEQCRTHEYFWTNFIEPHILTGSKRLKSIKQQTSFILEPLLNEYKDRFRNWFIDIDDDKKNEESLINIFDILLPELSKEIKSILSTIEISYTIPETIANLINIIDNVMKRHISGREQTLNLASITGDLTFIALKLSIHKAIDIEKTKHRQWLDSTITDLNDIESIIIKQYSYNENTEKQADIFLQLLVKQIVNESNRIYKQILIDHLYIKIIDESSINSQNILYDAYEQSMNSKPINGENILKYIKNINRYCLEICFNKIDIIKQHIVNVNVNELIKKINECLLKVGQVIQNNECKNLEQLYADLIKELCLILPGFNSQSNINIKSSFDIDNSYQFKQYFLTMDILDSETFLANEINCIRKNFHYEANHTCRTLIKGILGCQSKCPGCGTKCENNEENHQHHFSQHHLSMAFTGWNIGEEKLPNLKLCYQNWHIDKFIIRDKEFFPISTYYQEYAKDWFDDLNEKSKTGINHSKEIPPQEQRRAWMAVRKKVVKRHGLNDYTSYDDKRYPSTIQSLSSNFKVKWKDLLNN